MDEFEHRAEDIELDLVVGGVADAHRTRAGVARQLLDGGLGRQRRAVDGVKRREALGADLGGLDDPEEPVEEIHRLVDRAEFHESAGRERGVADPAVAVVPVADAADELGQACRGGSQDGAGRAVAEGLQRQRRAANQVVIDVDEGLGQFETGGPVGPERVGGRTAVGLGRAIRTQ